MHAGGCCAGVGSTAEAGRKTVYGTQTLQAGRNIFGYDEIPDRAEVYAACVSVCGQGAEHGSSGGNARRKIQDHSGEIREVYGY